ncbi:ABC transporter permease [Spirillospora sp. NPDC047279]|uniref:ABC transporter permease n=1 Tax=Spirillospora sp. NPDC047279 TaxID=3155478 RepID=UPI0033FDB4DE
MTSVTTPTAPAASGAAAPPKERRRSSSGGGGRPGSRLRVIAPIAVFVLVMGAWTFVSESVLAEDSRFLLPAPYDVIKVGLFDAANRAEILDALWSTTQIALTGLALAIVLGVLLAVVMSQARWAEFSLYPYAVVLQTIPILAVVPMFGFWFGYEFTSRVIVCVMVALFPTITNTLFGLKSVEPGLHDLFTLHGATRLQRLVRLQLPAALPAMVTGFKISGGMAIIGSIVADFFFRQGEPGIGRMIDVYRQRLATEQLLTCLILSSLVGLIVFWAFDLLGDHIDRRRSGRAATTTTKS